MPDLLTENAVILLGPTGAGKTPLGDLLQASGFSDRKVHHFDFGVWLRASAVGSPDWLNAAQIAVIRRVLHEGALLEEQDFGIAHEIIRQFVLRRRIERDDYIVFNGWPRDCPQATALAPMIRVALVVHIVCCADNVRARLSLNSGGDRTGRTDDTPEQVERRLAVYQERTRPLLDYYSQQGIVICEIESNAETTAEEMAQSIARQLQTGSKNE